MAKFDRVIPPGQEGLIELEIVSGKAKGAFNKSASIITNDPKHKKMTITLKGFISEYVVVEPATRLFLRGMYGNKVEKEVQIYANEKNIKEPFEITKVESDIDDKITYKIFPGEEKGKYVLKVWKNPNLPVSNSFGAITIHTNSEKEPKKLIHVQVTTKGEFIVSPSFVNFGRITQPLQRDKDKPLQKSLTISNPYGQFEIEDISFSVEGYRAKVDPIEEGKSYKVTVDFFPQMGGKNYLGDMLIHTDNPHEPTVTVRLIARM